MSCPAIKNLQVDLKNVIARTKSDIAKGVIFTSDGVDNKTLLEKYTGIYLGISKGSEKALDDAEAIESLESNVAYVTLRSNLKEVFKGSFGSGDTIGTKATNKLRLLSTDINGRAVTIKVQNVQTNKVGTYTFKKGTNVSERTKSGTRLYIPIFEAASSKAFKAVDDVMYHIDEDKYTEAGVKATANLREYLYGDSNVLGSEVKVLSGRRGVRKADYVHGDIDHMKSLLNELQVVGKNPTNSEHMKHLTGLFNSMSPSFFREMTLYINDNTNHTAGWVDLDKNSILLNMSKSKKSGSKSEAEVYAHEVIHTMTAWALNNKTDIKVSPIVRKLNYTMKKAAEKTSWEDLLGKPVEDATKGEIKSAKDLYEYTFNSENADHEFIAHILTNPVIMAHMKTITLSRSEEKAVTLFEKVMEFFYSLVDIILGNFSFKEHNNDVYKQVHALAFKLAEVNVEAEGTANKLNLIEKFNSWIDETDQGIGEKVDTYISSHQDDYKGLKKPKDSSAYEEFTYFSKFIGKSLINGHYRNALGVGMSNLGLKPEGSIREITRSLFTPNAHQRLVEWAGMKNSNIDTLRATVITQSHEAIKRGFREELSEDEDIALTRALTDVNLSQLMIENNKSISKKTYTKDELIKILKTGGKRELVDATKRLEELLANVEAKSEVNWVRRQAEGLGLFMATHKATLVQQTNAENIAIGYGSNVRRKLDQNLVEAINEVATLTALEKTKKVYKLNLADLMNKDYKGVKNVAFMYEAFKKESKEKIFVGDEVHMISGYTKELFDPNIDVQFVDVSKKEEMESLGYTLVPSDRSLVPKGGELRQANIGMFVSDMYGRPERLQGAVALGNLSARGVDLKSIKHNEGVQGSRRNFRNDMDRLNKKANELTEAMYKDDELILEAEDYGLSPILNRSGKVVNYRYMTIDKEEKAKRMKQELRVTETLARSMGALVDKELRVEHNKDVLELVKGFMKPEVWDGSDLGGEDGLVEYRRIGPNVANEDMREIFYMLPKAFQDFVNNREDKVLAVPADLINPLFGYTHTQLSNIVPKGVLPKKWHRVVQKIINMFEAVWVDLIKIAKGNILLKMPMVLVSNILSNVFFMINTGILPHELWRLHKESFRDVKEFMRKHKETTKLDITIKTLEAELRSGMGTEERSKLTKKVKGLKDRSKRIDKEMKESNVYELVEAGMFQSVVEDVETAHLNDNNIISSSIDKTLTKVPVYIKTPLQWMYLSKETKWYQFNQEVLQLSDLIARDVMNRKQKALEVKMINGDKSIPKGIAEELNIVQKGRKLTGETKRRFLELSKEHRMNFLLDSFINYNKPNGKFEEWTNRVGLLMFTKYIKRIQRVIFNTGAKHPIRTFGMLAAASLALDVDTIQDQAYIARGYGFNGDFSLGNIVPAYSPVDQFMNVVTPAILKDEATMGVFQ